MSDRPTWDQLWMRIAKTISERSCDSTMKVGAIIVSDDNTQLLSLGYNGNYAGGPNVRDSQVPGESGFIHAEVNCLLKLDYNNPKRKIMYVTHSPCVMCAKAIINAGVSEVVYEQPYRSMDGIDLLQSVGINCRQIGAYLYAKEKHHV